MKALLRFLVISTLQITFTISLYSNDLELTREFNLITSRNASGYLKPLFTTIGEGLNTSLYNTAYHSNGWSFGINISAMGMIIPDSHLSYDAELPDLYGNPLKVKTAGKHDGKLIENFGGTVKEPTLYGGKSYAIFASPQSSAAPDSFYKSVGFLEGNNIGMMPALPIFQLYFGLPTRSEIRFRYLTVPVQGSSLNYMTIGLTQNIDKLFGFSNPDDPLSYGFTFGYHTISRDNGIDISSMAFGLIGSNKFADYFQLYGGLQFETFSGKLTLIRKDFKPEDVLNSPYSEIRRGDNLNVDVESFNNFRLTLGASLDVSIFRFHGDVSYAAQPVLNFGVSFKIFEDIEEYFKPIEYIPNNPDEARPPQIAFSDFTNKYVAKAEPVVVIKPKVWDFDISLKMNGINESRVNPLDTIIVEEFESRQTRALLPYIFYAENESAIPEKYHKISNDEVNKFSFGQLSGKSPMESYYDVLNVIALRMKQKSSANIMLTGTNNNLGPEKNNMALSRQRAENIKTYLTQVWGIEDSRIKIEARNLPKVQSNNKDLDGQQENRRVEISSDDVEITAPVFIVDTLLRVRPESIQYLPNVKSEAGLASWSMKSAVGNLEFKKMNGKDNIENSYEWLVNNEGSKKRQLGGTLTTTFSARDKENNSREVVANNPIKIISVKDKRLNATKDTSLNVYNLILFDFNKSTLGETNKRITDFIKSEITPQTDVTIYGFTDRIGNDDYNMKLSAERAESTGKSLGGHPYKAIGIGESKLIYDNDLPEGRFYSRTVVVEAKVPIN
jgi:outer membrane protein OmpA-like peptidoglycan-associated protein